MKKFYFLLVVAMVSLKSFSQDVAVNSFRGLQWGAKLDSMYSNGKKLEFTKDKNPIDNARNSYTVNGDNMSIGNVKLNKLNYVFNDENRFVKVNMEGRKEDAEQMKFILEYKFGAYKNESKVDGVNYKQWLIKDVTFTLAEYEFLKFEVRIESNWQASEAYKKNTTVEDF